jgi:hypothetical protein
MSTTSPFKNLMRINFGVPTADPQNYESLERMLFLVPVLRWQAEGLTSRKSRK